MTPQAYENLKTVALGLGPYRNLTTLTASMLALHPHCQVLNHGAPHIIPNRERNFLWQYSDERFRNFVEYAIERSQGGQRGLDGGSITLAHAFDHSIMKETFEARFGQSRLKEDLRCLFWKEPLRVANFIRLNHTDLDGIFARNDRLRFLMPVRNPLDCALSNLDWPHKHLFLDLPALTREALVDAILKEIAWFLELQQRNPDRFFWFCEYEVDDRMLGRLASFLGLEPDARWLRDVATIYRLKPPYAHDPAYVAHYKRSLERHLAGWPDAFARLDRFPQPA